MSKRQAMHSLESVLSGDMLEVTPMMELSKILECPICQNIPTAPIYLCLTGHNICGTCRPKMDSCGFCHYAFTDCRNLAVESIVATSTFVCDNFERGCKLVTKGAELATHRDVCEHRPIKCPQGTSNGCEHSVIEFAEFLFHMQTVHFGVSHSTNKVGRAVVVTHELPDYNVQDYSWPLHFFQHDEKIFVIRSFLRRGSFHFILALLAVDSEAEGYTVRLRLRLPETGKKLPFKTTLPVVPVRTSDDEIIHKKFHMTFAKDVILPLCKLEDRQNNSIAWEVLYEVSKPNLAG